MDTPTTSAFQAVLLIVIGWALGFLSTEGTGWLQRRRDVKKERLKERRSHKAWLTGLQAELTHISTCINEIRGILVANIPTKRMNADFIEKARLTLFEYDEDVHFLESLTTTYRDIVHTNDMLDRFEENPGIRPNAMKSIDGVSDSVDGLARKVAAKLELLP